MINVFESKKTNQPLGFSPFPFSVVASWMFLQKHAFIFKFYIIKNYKPLFSVSNAVVTSDHQMSPCVNVPSASKR